MGEQRATRGGIRSVVTQFYHMSPGLDPAFGTVRSGISVQLRTESFCGRSLAHNFVADAGPFRARSSHGRRLYRSTDVMDVL
jgi:hypothetical protein